MTKSIAEAIHISPAQVKRGSAKNSPRPACRRRAVNRFANDWRVIDHHDQHKDGRDEREAFEENRQRIGGVESPETGSAARQAMAKEKAGREAPWPDRAIAAKARVRLSIWSANASNSRMRTPRTSDCDFQAGREEIIASRRNSCLKVGVTSCTNVCGKNPNQSVIATSSADRATQVGAQIGHRAQRFAASCP